MLFRDHLPPALNKGLEALLPSTFVVPRYEGASIANLPATLGHLFGLRQGWASPPLDEALLSSFGTDIEQVALVLVDGLGWQRLHEQLEQDDAGFGALLDAHGVAFAPLTSVAPSTTSVATTVLWGNGAAAAELGMLGYQFLLPALGVVANLLFWHPAGQAGARYGSLESWGVAPETFLPTPSLAQVLRRGGVAVHSLIPYAYAHSPLSRMQQRGAEVTGYLSSTDMWLKLERHVQRATRGYTYAYYPFFDSLGHRDGVQGDFFPYLWQDFTAQLARFVRQLGRGRSGRTLLLLSADHGHVVTPPSARRSWQSVPDLLERTLLPGGEPRHLYLYTQDGDKVALLEALRQELGEAFAVLDGKELLAAGLYGDPGRAHPQAQRRLGDIVVLAKGPSYLWNARDEGVMLGMHGGLEPEEMVVPLIALRV